MTNTTCNYVLTTGTSQSWQTCGSIPPESELCCLSGDICIGNSICRALNSKEYYIGGCTSEQFPEPACSDHCAAFSSQDVVYNSTAQNWACCFNEATNTSDCGNPGNVTFGAPPPGQLKAATIPAMSASIESNVPSFSSPSSSSPTTSNIPSLSSRPSSSSPTTASAPKSHTPSYSVSNHPSITLSPSSSNSTSSSPAPYSSSGSHSSGAKYIGIGIGITIGGLGLIAAIIFILQRSCLTKDLNKAKLIRPDLLDTPRLSSANGATAFDTIAGIDGVRELETRFRTVPEIDGDGRVELETKERAEL